MELPDRNNRAGPPLQGRTVSGCVMSAFMMYVIGFVVLLAGLIYGAVLIHVPHTWIIVAALILVGLGIMSAVSHTKRRDPPSEAPEA